MPDLQAVGCRDHTMLRNLFLLRCGGMLAVSHIISIPLYFRANRSRIGAKHRLRLQKHRWPEHSAIREFRLRKVRRFKYTLIEEYHMRTR